MVAKFIKIGRQEECSCAASLVGVKRVLVVAISSMLGAEIALTALSNSNDNVPIVWESLSPGFLLVAFLFNYIPWNEDALWAGSMVANAVIYGVVSNIVFGLISKRLRQKRARSQNR